MSFLRLNDLTPALFFDHGARQRTFFFFLLQTGLSGI